MGRIADCRTSLANTNQRPSLSNSVFRDRCALSEVVSNRKGYNIHFSSAISPPCKSLFPSMPVQIVLMPSMPCKLLSGNLSIMWCSFRRHERAAFSYIMSMPPPFKQIRWHSWGGHWKVVKSRASKCPHNSLKWWKGAFCTSVLSTEVQYKLHQPKTKTTMLAS